MIKYHRLTVLFTATLTLVLSAAYLGAADEPLLFSREKQIVPVRSHQT